MFTKFILIISLHIILFSMKIIFYYLLAIILFTDLFALCFKEYRKWNPLSAFRLIRANRNPWRKMSLKRAVKERTIDIVTFPLLCIAFVFAPLIYLTLKLEDHLQKRRLKFEYISDYSSRKREFELEKNKYYLYAPKMNWEPDTNERLFFTANLPFEPYEQQIIYIENHYDPYINEYILQNLQDLKDFCDTKGFDFCYLPQLDKNIDWDKTTQYYCPTASNFTNLQPTPIKSNMLLPYLYNKTDIKPALIRYFGKKMSEMFVKESGLFKEGEKVYCFSYFPLPHPDEGNMEDQLHWYFSHIGKPTILYSIPKDETYEADDHFDYEARKLMREIKERIDTLRIKGIDQMVLNELVKPETKLSKLHITKKYKIFLPDYNHIEIVMRPLPKAVFFLFLNHPEGIKFKELSNYENELKNIYESLSGRIERAGILQSVLDVTNPTKNSINEKCARVRESFIIHFDETLAQNYYITGERGEPKKITLPRNLVEWERPLND